MSSFMLRLEQSLLVQSLLASKHTVPVEPMPLGHTAVPDKRFADNEGWETRVMTACGVPVFSQLAMPPEVSRKKLWVPDRVKEDIERGSHWGRSRVGDCVAHNGTWQQEHQIWQMSNGATLSILNSVDATDRIRGLRGVRHNMPDMPAEFFREALGEQWTHEQRQSVHVTAAAQPDAGGVRATPRDLGSSRDTSRPESGRRVHDWDILPIPSFPPADGPAYEAARRNAVEAGNRFFNRDPVQQPQPSTARPGNGVG